MQIYTEPARHVPLQTKTDVLVCGGGPAGIAVALAGCSFELGRPESGECQLLTLMALITGVHASKIAPYIGGQRRRGQTMLPR